MYRQNLRSSASAPLNHRVDTHAVLAMHKQHAYAAGIRLLEMVVSFNAVND